jgi:hypothetical protein
MSVGRYFLHTVKIGDVIIYNLRPQDLPTNPNMEWKGRVLKVYVDNPYVVDCVRVESLEPGETGETELAYPSQIIRIETIHHQNRTTTDRS